MRPVVRTSLFIHLVLIALVAISDAFALPDENPARPQLPLMDSWRFHRGPVAAGEAASLDDHDWAAVSLPHTWNAQDGEDGGGDYFRGDGWYRRHFRVPIGWKRKQVYLQFDGASRSAEVYLNGHRLGLHRGGFARFRFDATPALTFDGDNLIAVRVNNGENDNIAPLLGDFTMFGGLYRGVSLLATERVQIETLDRASDGVFVRAGKVSSELAELDIKVELASHEASACDAEVRVSVLASDGHASRQRRLSVDWRDRRATRFRNASNFGSHGCGMGGRIHIFTACAPRCVCAVSCAMSWRRTSGCVSAPSIRRRVSS